MAMAALSGVGRYSMMYFHVCTGSEAPESPIDVD